jgi:DNA-binding response OmpR family regulator
MRSRVAVFSHSNNVLRLFHEVLTRQGFEVFTFQQEVEKLAEIDLLRPDIIVMASLQEHNRSEMEIIRQLRMWPATSRIPILVCANDQIAEDVSQYNNSHDSHRLSILAAPFDLAQIVLVINMLLIGEAEQSSPKSEDFASVGRVM